MTLAPASARVAADQAMSLETELATRSMGGGLRLLVASAPATRARAERDLRRLADRIDAWARRLTRFRDDSDLCRLNQDPERSPVALPPTLAAVLAHAREMAAATRDTVDVSMLEARLAAETGAISLAGGGTWALDGDGHRANLIRHGRVRFDLDGVAKGWIADRALRHLDGYAGALVDADGDIAMRAPAALGWEVAVGHPNDESIELARLQVPRDWPSGHFGVATSGTSVHRWQRPEGSSHHLIDPRTGRPAVTDVEQATVVAAGAGPAEALAKAALIRGSHDGLRLLERAGVWAALLLLASGELLTSAGTEMWVA
jgi:thiamine biosynthesis lipoprotein